MRPSAALLGGLAEFKRDLIRAQGGLIRRPLGSDLVSTEERVPQAWYAMVYASQAEALRSYLDHYRAMEDPKLEAMPSAGAVYAKLSSSLFAGVDHTDVAREAQRLVEIITGAAKIKQAPGNLTLRSVVAVYADGEIKMFSLLRTYFSAVRSMTRFKDEARGDRRDPARRLAG